MKNIKTIKNIVLTSTFLLGLFFCGCNDSDLENIPSVSSNDITNIEIGNDSSYSNSAKVGIEHLHLDLDVKFESKSIYGIARYRLKRHFSDTILFDINGLQIQKVTIGKIGNERNTEYIIGKEDSTLGAPLSIRIKPKTRFINIYYQTTEKPTNLHWDIDSSYFKHSKLYLIPGEKYTRNWIPIQDVSNQKIDFSIEIQNDLNLTPLFGSKHNLHQLDSNRFFYESPSKINVYDIVFFMGYFKQKSISKNITMYYLDNFNSTKSLKEFNHFNTYLKHVENLLGKHPWKEFNFCILPGNFPYKSFDYPNLAFIHPVSLGNYMNSGDFIQEYLFQTWPKPLFSTKCEDNRQLIIGMNKYLALRSKGETLGNNYLDMLIKSFIETNRRYINKYNVPLVRLTNIYSKPCDFLKDYNYSERMNLQLKGFMFFLQLDKKLGNVGFNSFLKAFIQKPTLHNKEDFEREINHFLIQNEYIDFNYKKFLNGTNVSKSELNFESKRYKTIHKDCKLFSYQRKLSKIRKFKKLTKKYTIDDWFVFLSLLPKTIQAEKLDYLEYHYHFSKHPNKAIQRLWFEQSIRFGYIKTAPAIIDFLSTYGDIESNYQLYEQMLPSQVFKTIALDTYLKNEQSLSTETKKALKPLFQRFNKI